jgi:hypothetical protein
LYVQPPVGNLIFFGNRNDVESGGTFGEDPNQTKDGFNVENTFFPDTAPAGTYFFFVAPFNVRGEADVYTLTVNVNGMDILSFSGIGASSTFEFIWPGARQKAFR